MENTPQLENGYTPIANEILERLCEINLTSYQFRVLLYIFRKTYGFHKKEDWISVSQIVEATGIKQSHVSRTKKELVAKNILYTPTGIKVSFQKDWRLWNVDIPNEVYRKNIPNQDKNIPNEDKNIPVQGDTKNNIQKIITKDIEGFSEFLSRFNQLFGKNYRPTAGLKDKYQKRLKTFTHSEIMSAVESIAKSKFHTGDNNRHWIADPMFLIRSDEQVDKWRARDEVVKPVIKTLASMIPDSINNF